MVELKIDFDYKAWDRVQEKVLKVPPRALKLASDDANREVKKYLSSRIKWNRYRLISSISARRETENRYEITSRGKPMEYEKYVHNGRGSFSAKNKKALHWVNSAGEDVFVRKPRKVKAFKGYYHYRHTADKIRPGLDKYVSEAMNGVGLQ